MKKRYANSLSCLIVAVSGVIFASIGAADGADLKNPSAIVFDQSKNLFVADDVAQTIFKIAPDGSKSVFATGLKLSNGNCLSFDAAGNLFVLSPSGQYHVGGNILKFTPEGTKTTFAGDAGLPYSIAIDAEGNVFVSDWDTGSIFKFTQNGTKTVFATAGEVGSPLAIDRAGNLFAVDQLKGTILKFNSAGASTPFATGARAFALAVDQSGNLFAADNEDAIFKFTPDGARSEFAKLDAPAKAIAFDNMGNLYTAGVTTGAIQKVAAGGEKTPLVAGQQVEAREETDSEADTAEGLPEKYAKNYLLAQSTLSPDKKFAIIYPTKDDEEFPGGANYLVSLKPFAVLTKLETKRPYFKNESHGGLTVEWSDDGSVALITLEAKWGPGDIFLVELKNGKLTRTTNLLGKMHDLLLPDYKSAKAGRYNDYYDFVFESEEDAICQLDGAQKVQINALATTDPKGADEGRVWDGRLIATWDIAQGKFTSQKVAREFAGVRKHEE